MGWAALGAVIAIPVVLLLGQLINGADPNQLRRTDGDQTACIQVGGLLTDAARRSAKTPADFAQELREVAGDLDNSGMRDRILTLADNLEGTTAFGVAEFAQKARLGVDCAELFEEPIPDELFGFFF